MTPFSLRFSLAPLFLCETFCLSLSLSGSFYTAMKRIILFYARLTRGTGVGCRDWQTCVKNERKQVLLRGETVGKEHSCHTVWWRSRINVGWGTDIRVPSSIMSVTSLSQIVLFIFSQVWFDIRKGGGDFNLIPRVSRMRTKFSSMKP